MKFHTKRDATYYRNRHVPQFREKLKVVKTQYWSAVDWCWVPCWTVVMK